MDEILTWEPVLKERVWGGEKLWTVLGKKGQVDGTRYGESWELFSFGRSESSRVKDGTYRGKTLYELMDMHCSSLLGERMAKAWERGLTRFPLLIKCIDAKETLSVQVHPGDKMAKEVHGSMGKTEMWYIIQADEGARRRPSTMGSKKRLRKRW